MRSKLRQEIQEMIQEMINDKPIGSVYVKCIKYEYDDMDEETIIVHPQNNRMVSKDIDMYYKWLGFSKIEDQVGNNIKVLGIWYKKEDVILYSDIYSDRCKEIEERLTKK
jgi:hypothetical protein